MKNYKGHQVAKKLKEIREYLGFGLDDVAANTKVDLAELASIESGQIDIKETDLIDILNLYKYPLDYLLSEETFEEEVGLLARTNKDLNELDCEQVMKFAQLLSFLGTKS